MIAATALDNRKAVVTFDAVFMRVPRLPLMLLDRATFDIAQQL